MKSKLWLGIGLSALLVLPVGCLEYGMGSGDEDSITEEEENQGGDDERREQEEQEEQEQEQEEQVLDCLTLSVDECDVPECQILEAYDWDAESQCRGDELRPAFCRPYADILCYWEGDPVIMTAPDGGSWYMDFSCFSIPQDWQVEYLSELQDVCGEEEEEIPCIDLPVEECEAHGCQVFEAYPYDAEAGCYDAGLMPAFCRADPDIICGWQGDPVIMTEPDGSTWYMDWSCFSTPGAWDIEYLTATEVACD